jgi:N-acetylmuramoyl-L-alanine amidase
LIKHLLIILLLSAGTLYSQLSRIPVEMTKGSVEIPSYERQGTLYISIKHFAEALSLQFSLNSLRDRITIYNDDLSLTVTSRNPFFIFSNSKELKKNIYQIPTSTYHLNNLIFIPLNYSLDHLRRAAGRSIIISSKNKIIVGDEPVKEIPAASIIKPSSQFDINSIIIDEKSNGTMVRIRSRKKADSYSSSIENGILSLRIRGVSADVDKINSSKGTGLIRSIKSRNSEAGTELTFQLTQDYTTSEIIPVEGSGDLILTIHNKVFARSEEMERIKSKWEFDVIVLDAGHGGKDPGAVGVNGVKEKDINLSITLKLGELIEKKMPGVKVVYTRKNDTFVELYKRGKIANEAGGKLFISIHCNSTPNKKSSANGFEVYLLRPGRTKEAIAIAERENSVIQYEDNPERYQKLNDENFILVSMAHSAYMKYSEKFSELLDNQFSRDLPLISRGVKQAGFYVLVGASMPSVLIETGFLSNKKEADYLASSKGQQKFAEAIFEGIKKFKKFYDQVLEAEL